MGLILIDGGPAAGKNTLGELLVEKFNDSADKKFILLDMDIYIERYNPKWIWDNPKQEEKDRFNAEMDFTKDIDKYLRLDFVAIVIGVRFLTKQDISNFVFRIKTKSPVYLYHLIVPFALREQRLRRREPHSIIDLKKDQKDRDAIKNWPGFVYKNINTPEMDASNLMALIQKGDGLFSM